MSFLTSVFVSTSLYQVTNTINYLLDFYNNVGFILLGKCLTCAKLTEARKRSKGKEVRTYYTTLHYLHKSAYMAERACYRARKAEAKKDINDALSIIGDGMAQNHCELPYWANLKQIPGIKQHLQGVLSHGRYKIFNEKLF